MTSVVVLFPLGIAHAQDVATDASQDVSFNSGFLMGSKKVDLSRYEKAGVLVPGEYRLDIYINDDQIGRRDVRIETSEDGSSRVCFSGKEIKQWAINLSKLDDPKAALLALDSDCVEITRLVPGVSIAVDQGAQSAHISIPQLYLSRRSRGYVSPENWDNGITAGFVGYNASIYQNANSGQTSRNLYVGINAGANIDGWRLRHNGSLNATESSAARTPSTSHYNALSTYVQHDVTALQAQATAGQYYTPGDLFDSVPFTGVQLSSDDRMMPDSQRDFAPEIRGTAETNAKITVRQGNNVVYETTVAPGPFLIDDLSSTGYSGDLNVTITEADGRQKSFVVPYSSVAQLLRPGASRFSATAGKYRDSTLSHTPVFAQGTYRRGISNMVTAYGGGIVADKYMSALGGLALNTDYGAFAADVTASHATDLPTAVAGKDGTMSGQSYRLTYSQTLPWTSTNVALAAYRFSSAGYLSLQDDAQLRGLPTANLYRDRTRMQLNVSQPLGERGSMYVSGMTNTYWNHGGRSMTFQSGYSTSFDWGSVNLSAGRTYTNGSYSNQMMAMFSVPLGKGGNPIQLSTSLNYQSPDQYSAQTNLSGSAGEHNELGYGVYASANRNAGSNSASYGGNVAYQGSLANVGATASRSGNSSQYSASARGTVVGYGGGVVATAAQGETMAIVEADGAAGAHINGGSGDTLDWWGHGVVTGLNPYRNNDISLDPKGTSNEVELSGSSAIATPRYGAIVKLKYDTVVGKPLLIHAALADGKPAPFGADVFDAKGTSVGVVGQAGQIFLRGQPEEGTLQVKWGEGADESCSLRYHVELSEKGDAVTAAYQQTAARCAEVMAGK
ncbi:outer membrane usher protein [Silvimonas terrae]|uniref:Outer membrane usher protein n=1 Tax=Silvimonas terrae TaxID=300266 RepID=A0A840RE97_9NEIS|nr:fimbria/pilus outer membrane usher protein [Silvimonas terrae]MBB5191839.1 outer membrane usher protein [Silvimonas terrae]